MIRRLYVHNFRCLQNFTLDLAAAPSVLLIGGNGVGKTSVLFALELLQKITRGINRVSSLIRPGDLHFSAPSGPARIELEASVQGHEFKYTIAFEFPQDFKELRVYEESLHANGTPLFTRTLADVSLGGTSDAAFRIDWHLAALPIIQERSIRDPLYIFKNWMSLAVLLRPIPALMEGGSEGSGSLWVNPNGSNFGAWFTGLLAFDPEVYAVIEREVRQYMPDFKDIKNPVAGRDYRSLVVQFATGENRAVLPFAEISNGEKCYFLGATALAAAQSYGPILCFWDEPDNHLAISEVGSFVMQLRRNDNVQFIATSHNSEVIRKFSDETTFLVERADHFSPPTARRLSELTIHGDLVEALARGDVHS